MVIAGITVRTILSAPPQSDGDLSRNHGTAQAQMQPHSLGPTAPVPSHAPLLRRAIFDVVDQALVQRVLREPGGDVVLLRKHLSSHLHGQGVPQTTPRGKHTRLAKVRHLAPLRASKPTLKRPRPRLSPRALGSMSRHRCSAGTHPFSCSIRSSSFRLALFLSFRLTLFLEGS